MFRRAKWRRLLGHSSHDAKKIRRLNQLFQEQTAAPSTRKITQRWAFRDFLRVWLEGCARRLPCATGWLREIASGLVPARPIAGYDGDPALGRAGTNPASKPLECTSGLPVQVNKNARRVALITGWGRPTGPRLTELEPI